MTEYQIFGKKPSIERELMKKWTTVSKWKTVLLCIAIYVGVILMAWMGKASNYWLAPISVLVIAALQNHLLIVFHEGSHWLMHPNRKWNDFWTDLFSGAPLFQYVCNYRLLHWTHHRSTGVENVDPEIALYRDQDYTYGRRSAGGVAWMFLKDLFFVNLIKFQTNFYTYIFRNVKENGHKHFGGKELVSLLLVWVPVVLVVNHFNLWLDLVIFWLLPMFTVMFFLLKLHAYGEHTGLDGPTELERTWFHHFPFVSNFFVYPINSGYHVEHHLFPTVPWYSMPAVRRYLMQNPYYVEQSEKVTLDGVFFGKRTIMNAMVFGKGHYVDEAHWKTAFDKRSGDLSSIAKVAADSE